VEELRRGLRALSLAPPYVLVGHSYGGFVVKLYAARHPDEVAGIVLVDVPHPRKWTRLDDAERKRIEGGVRAARRGAFLARFGLVRLLFRLLAARRIESLPGLLSKLPDAHRAAIRGFWVRPSTLRALASLIEETPRSAVLVESASLDLGNRPLAVLTASSPSRERARDQEEETRKSRRSRHIVAERSGHWIPLEEPELVVEAIREVTAEARRLLASGGPSGPEAAGTRGGETTPSGP
jgi:pimeloyl-ACP methyl ester carboxylesterase